MLTFIRGFHTVWSWNVVLSCWTDRDKLWRHRTAPIWTFRSLQFIPFTICSIRFSVSMIWNVHKSYLISEKAQTWGCFFHLFHVAVIHPTIEDVCWHLTCMIMSEDYTTSLETLALYGALRISSFWLLHFPLSGKFCPEA